jgi:hypothetical protein
MQLQFYKTEFKFLHIYIQLYILLNLMKYKLKYIVSLYLFSPVVKSFKVQHEDMNSVMQ